VDIGFAIGSAVRLQVPGVRTENRWAPEKFGGEFAQGTLTFGSSNLVYFCEPTLRTRLPISGWGPSRQLVRRNEMSGVEVVAEVTQPFCDVENDPQRDFNVVKPVAKSPTYATRDIIWQPCSFSADDHRVRPTKCSRSVFAKPVSGIQSKRSAR